MGITLPGDIARTLNRVNQRRQPTGFVVPERD